MANLARMIGEPERAVELRQATVTAPPGADGTATIRFGAGGGTIAGVRTVGSASFNNGDTVWVLQQGYDMMILGRIGGGGYGSPLVSPGIELYHPNATPYIDFHRAANPAGDGGADYNVRLINEANGQLNIYAGALHKLSVGGLESAGRAWAGISGAYGGWAQFSHKDYWNSGTSYGLMHDGGSALLSANTQVCLRYQNDDRLGVAAGDVFVTRPINMRGNKIWTKQYGDDTHRINWDGGFDGHIFSTWGDSNFYQTGNRHMTVANVGVFGIGPGTGGNWGQAQLRSEDSTGGSSSIASHCPGAVAHIMELWRGDSAIHWRRSDGAWMWVHCDVDDLSMESIKKDIRNLESTRAKVKAIHPKKYKRKRPDDPTAPEIIARHAESHREWKEQCREGRWSPEAIAQSEAYWNSEEVGFLSEEMALVFPEVVTWDTEGKPLGIRYQKLTPILWQMNQEQDEEIEALKKRIEALEKNQG